ncbi:MAG TPA: cytochrome c oxidase assembly protein, partial [Kineosporiaceae bacterium]|nr:cytochrome c oxidase assembly protein [Kineosporiaceae bacterium]
VDPSPRPIPHLARLGLVLAAMPFHAFFGVAIMMSRSIIAGTFYSYLAAENPWMHDLEHDQYVGGGIAWAAGEVPLVFVLVVLLVQWSRQDAKDATRHDRHLDSGVDSSFQAYNLMLERLAEHNGADLRMPTNDPVESIPPKTSRAWRGQP